jgi:hypothetical protein
VPQNPNTSLKITSALGIQAGDIVTTAYNSGPYMVHQIHGPITHFTGVGHLVILDHPEISLILSTANAKRKGTAGFINNIRQVNSHWYTAQNDEIFITRHPAPEREPTSLLDLFDPLSQVEILPIPPLYPLNPTVNYQAGPRRAWHCPECDVDFNAIPTHKHWCEHDCQTIANEIFYIRAPEPDDRRPHFSYYVMTLNSYEYGPIPTYQSTNSASRAKAATAT